MRKKPPHLNKFYLAGLLVAGMITVFSFVWRKYIQDAESRGINLNREAFEKQHQPERFDLIVFLNGLNDLTNGATAKTLYGEKIQPADGSSWTPLYHAHDYRQRVSDYLNNMDAAWTISHKAGCDMLVVLQPSLVERASRTKIEEALLKGSLVPHASAQAFTES